ncbi:YciI family protein [uncultured Brevundimonas sp.]|uniref:YciI family protein n=1 Tax=uncultured Brevundimonas sp. TaxID=213418 RepID=UPI00260BC3FC|nr:YciI family protein [uncultured Brevundimonas sp.]
MSTWLYRLTVPRQTFPGDITEAEGAIMERHGAYWSEWLASGAALVFGPVADPSGFWGLAVIQAEDEAAARRLAEGDPAIEARAGFGYDLFEMPGAVSAMTTNA